MLKNGNHELVFGKQINNSNGYLPAADIAPMNEHAAINLDEGRSININELHKMLGHVSEAKLRDTTHDMSWKLTGKIEKCEDCAIGKAKRAQA